MCNLKQYIQIMVYQSLLAWNNEQGGLTSRLFYISKSSSKRLVVAPDLMSLCIRSLCNSFSRAFMITKNETPFQPSQQCRFLGCMAAPSYALMMLVSELAPLSRFTVLVTNLFNFDFMRGFDLAKLLAARSA